MKAERRHEIKTNTLADYVGNKLIDAGPNLKFYVGGAVALFALLFTFLYINDQTRRGGSDWDEFFEASYTQGDDGSALKTVAESESAKPAQWARLNLADLRLASASRSIFRDRKSAEEDLAEAKEHYSAVIKSAPAGSMLHDLGVIGLGLVYETRGDADEAKGQYKQVASSDSAYAELASKSLKRIETLQEKDWYAWFAEAESFDPGDPGTWQTPENLDELPDRPDFSFPGETSDLFDSIIDVEPSDGGAADKDGDKDGAAKDGAAKDGAAKDGAAKDGAAKDGDKDGAAKDGAAKDGAAKDGAAKDGAAKDSAAKDGGAGAGNQP